MSAVARPIVYSMNLALTHQFIQSTRFHNIEQYLNHGKIRTESLALRRVHHHYHFLLAQSITVTMSNTAKRK